MMANERDVTQSVASYLARHGWRATAGGPAGELWTLEDRRALEQVGREVKPTLAVPHEVEADSFEFNSIVDRLARHQSEPRGVVAIAVVNEFTDEQNYRIADRYVTYESADLDTASTVVSSARKLVRAAATTSRKPRARIGANYSKPGDELAGRARLSHTRRGSFILPVVMPVTPPESTAEQFDSGIMPIEPGERGVTRTLASALAALDTIAVRPARTPGPDEVRDLVQSGVSKELVAAVREVTISAGIDAFDVSFQWAPALGDPPNIPQRVRIEDDAAPVLSRIADELGKLKADPDASVSGQIVRIFYVQGDPTGEFAIRTERGNRVVDVHVTASSKIIHDAYVWAHDHRAVLARGRIERRTGKPLSIPKPTAILPIDSLFADSLEADPS